MKSGSLVAYYPEMACKETPSCRYWSVPFDIAENIVIQRLNTQSTIFTFSAKEKDAETGYSYFGSRYYSSDLSIWLSVDPMASKYPHQSNYVYCSNNPIKVVDPNGETEYEFDQKGKLVNTIDNDNKFDQIHIIDEAGKRLSSSKEYEAETIFNMQEDVPSNSSLCGNATIFEVGNQEVSDEIFSFMAENTSVEWGTLQAESKDDGSCHNFVGTNHNEGRINVTTIIENKGYSIERTMHNHPDGLTISEADHKAAVSRESRNPNLQSYLYRNGLLCPIHRYNSSTPYINDNFRTVIPK